MSLFLKKPIPDIVRDIKCKKISPKDLLEESSNSFKTWEKKVKAWVNFDTVHASARGLEKDLINNRDLECIPFGTKDIFNTKDFPTEMGSTLWKGFTPGNNARVVDNILRGGGVPIGKTVTAEFAVHELNETRNPHDYSKTPGTSSSGSAVAVATGMVPFALATQTAGSISRPASFCGVWGMKPSFGMIPRTGVLKTTDSLDTIGFVAAFGKSLKPILDSVRVKGPNYPFIFKNVDLRPQNLKNNIIKVAFVKTHVWRFAQPYVKTALKEFLEKLGKLKFVQLSEASWPEMYKNTHLIHNTIYKKSLSYYFKNEFKLSKHISLSIAKMISDGEKISSEKYLKALGEQAAFCKSLDCYLAKYDVVISFATASSAPLRHVKEPDDPSLIWTLGHVPCITVPQFLCPEGMPFGLQFSARKYSDYRLLDIIEKLTEHEILFPGSAPIKCKHKKV